MCSSICRSNGRHKLKDFVNLVEAFYCYVHLSFVSKFWYSRLLNVY
uniref:Uncharacterized protein n=1 Tax=Arundo donax TaxID=35708 RepID=A0A0A9HNY6_ARUDO